MKPLEKLKKQEELYKKPKKPYGTLRNPETPLEA